MILKQTSNVSSKKYTSEKDVENGETELKCEKNKQENEVESGDELQFQDQSSRMPLKKILIVYLGIGQEPDRYTACICGQL
jgi:hypothetical protein